MKKSTVKESEKEKRVPHDYGTLFDRSDIPDGSAS
jgi:hypothetical protein